VDAHDQLLCFLQLADTVKMPETDREKILYANARDLYVNPK
jgi:predicted TIM-barrel fold metal-dependent hydrolase